jgi:hypothetical protein
MNTINYQGTNEILHITRYQLLLVLERLEKQKAKSPLFEHAMIPFSLLISTLVTLITADFRDSFGLNADVWQMFILTVMVLSALITAILFVLWAKNRGSCKLRTPDEIVKEIIEQMEHQQKEVFTRRRFN